MTSEQCPFDGKHFSSSARSACEVCNPQQRGVLPSVPPTPASSNHNAYVPLLNGTAFMGMAKVGECGTFDTTNGPYVRAADYEQVDKAWTAHLLMYAECIKERDHWKTVAEARGRDLLRNAQLLSGSADETSGGVDAFTWELARKQLDRLVGLEEERARYRGALNLILGAAVPLGSDSGHYGIEKVAREALEGSPLEPSGGLCEGP